MDMTKPFNETPIDQDLSRRLRTKAKNFMLAELRDRQSTYFDGIDVNWTSLAEAAADHLNAYVDMVDYTVHEEFFELSLEVGQEWLEAHDLGD